MSSPSTAPKKSETSAPAPGSLLQETVFLNGEGDAWFDRSQKQKADPDAKIANDMVLRTIADYSLNPRRVLSVGCSNGWRLAAIEQRYGSDCTGIDPSNKAILSGREEFPKLRLIPGTAASMNLPEGETFDLVIASFVLHWISRPLLLNSIAQIDSRVSEGGFLLLADFSPDWPTQNVYHHLDPGLVYTYKADYASLFETTRLYSRVSHQTFDSQDGLRKGAVDSDSRAFCALLRKSSTGLFIQGRRP
ncbi:MAG: class I SAM-dependent methyltransferase [Acidobacteriota bacterium]